jgi:hypothetical protein
MILLERLSRLQDNMSRFLFSQTGEKDYFGHFFSAEYLYVLMSNVNLHTQELISCHTCEGMEKLFAFLFSKQDCISTDRFLCGMQQHFFGVFKRKNFSLYCIYKGKTCEAVRAGKKNK